ncbi:unnamed protein product [Caretta caretta]
MKGQSKGLVDRNPLLLLLCVCQSSLALSAVLWLLLPALHNNATDQSYCIPPPPMLANHPDGCKPSEKIQNMVSETGLKQSC